MKRRIVIAVIVAESAFLLALALTAPAWAGMHEAGNRGVSASDPAHCAWAWEKTWKTGVSGRTLWWMRETAHWCRTRDHLHLDKKHTRFTWDYDTGAAWNFSDWVYQRHTWVTTKPPHAANKRKAHFVGDTAIPWLHDNDEPWLGMTVYLPAPRDRTMRNASYTFNHGCDDC